MNLLELAEGDRLDILAPGPLLHSLTLRGIGSSDAPITVTFTPGRYEVYPKNAAKRTYHISNAKDAPYDPKSIGILLEGAKHVRVSGPGARLVAQGILLDCRWKGVRNELGTESVKKSRKGKPTA